MSSDFDLLLARNPRLVGELTVPGFSGPQQEAASIAYFSIEIGPEPTTYTHTGGLGVLSGLPMFYERPSAFAAIMRSCIALNGSYFNAQRMVVQYLQNAYLPSGSPELEL